MRIPVFDLNGHFEIPGDSIANSLNRRIPFWWIEWSAQLDWALVLLAVSGGYTSPRAVIDYALSSLSSSSPDEVYDLVILNYEEHPNWTYEQKALTKIALRIHEDEWRNAKKRLFYSLVYWEYVNRGTFSWWRFDASYYLNMLWEDFDHPYPDDLFTNQAYEIDEKAYREFIQKHWGEYTSSSSSTGIDVVQAGASENQRVEANISRRLVAEPIAYLLAGDSDPFLRQLREQFRNSEIIGEQYTGVGYYIDFKVRNESLRIQGYRQDVIFGDLEADIGDGSVGFLLRIEDGFIANLEAYCIDGEGWPPKEHFVNYRYDGEEGFTSNLEERSWEKLRQEWELPASTRPYISQDSLMYAFVLGKDNVADESAIAKPLEWLKTGKGFSAGSFFLGPVYWMYRKCYIAALALGVIYTVGALILSFIVHMQVEYSRFVVKIIQYVCFAVVAFLFPRIYRVRYLNVVKKASDKYLYNRAEVIKSVAQQGGVDSVSAVLACIVFVIAITVSATWLLGILLGM